jgi:hypothetical protein
MSRVYHLKFNPKIVVYYGVKMNREVGSSREISSSHGGEYDVQSCLLGCTNPEDSSEHHGFIPL